jgi:hypothetical protein
MSGLYSSCPSGLAHSGGWIAMGLTGRDSLSGLSQGRPPRPIVNFVQSGLKLTIT